jgi:stage V sporulation protein B
MSDQQQKNTSFFGGAAILAVGIMIVKVISMFYKIPLSNILGSSGYTHFTAAFNIFNVLLMISTAGIPVAMSKMISQATAQGRQRQAHKIFRVSFLFFMAIGIFCSLVMFFGAETFAKLMNDTQSAYSMRMLAPSVALVCGLAAFRGYAQGHQNMTPSSISQIIEALFKLIVGLTLAYYVMEVLGKDESIGAAAAIVGVTISELAALIYMALEFLHYRRRELPGTNNQTDSAKSILRMCLGLAIPITLTSSATSIITMVDNSLVLGRLQHAGLMLSESAATTLMGNYSVVQTVYQIPASLMVAITASVIPAVTVCFTQGRRKDAARVVGSSLKVASILAFPSGIGMLVLGKPIVQLLFPLYDVEVAGRILSILGIASIFVCMMLVCNSILQSHGILHMPIITMLIGGVLMVIFDYVMVGNAEINIFGSPVGTCICYGTTACLDMVLVRRIVRGCPSYRSLLTKPLISALVMGLAAWASYGLLFKVTHSSNLSLMVALVVAVVVYFALLLALGTLTREDMSLMPKGDKLSRLLHIK